MGANEFLRSRISAASLAERARALISLICCIPCIGSHAIFLFLFSPPGDCCLQHRRPGRANKNRANDRVRSRTRVTKVGPLSHPQLEHRHRQPRVELPSQVPKQQGWVSVCPAGLRTAARRADALPTRLSKSVEARPTVGPPSRYPFFVSWFYDHVDLLWDNTPYCSTTDPKTF